MTSPVTVTRVLVGVDFDGSSAAAMRVAGAIADAFGASLVAAHATTVDVPPYFTLGQVASLEAEQQETRTWLAERVREVAGQYSSALSAVRIEEGPPAVALLRLAREADLLVVGTHRFKGPRRWWLGSVAEAVVRSAPVPVVVVPSGTENVPALRPGAIVLAPAAAGDARVEAWIDALRQALAAEVQRTGSISACPAERIQQADLVVVPLPATADGDQLFEDVIHVLKECTHPVLFVPPAAPQATFRGDLS